MLCQRIESTKPHSRGGWFHFYDDKAQAGRFIIPKARPAPQAIDAEAKIRRWQAMQSQQMLTIFAENLGVTPNSLFELGCAWSVEYKAWAFPMSDGAGKIIGIRLRNETGFKWAVTGSRQGIFLPAVDPQPITFLPEGPTDTAACLSLGLFAIGRPSCNSGNELIAQALKRLGIYKVVIVADNDEIKQGGKRPGIEGAIKLKKELKLSSVIWSPPAPIKDVREFLKVGGTKQMIESEIKNKVWNKQ